MTDTAIWRNPNGFVLRLNGSEHYASEDDLLDLRQEITNVLRGERLSCGTEYEELRKRPVSVSVIDLRKLLNLKGAPQITRR